MRMIKRSPVAIAVAGLAALFLLPVILNAAHNRNARRNEPATIQTNNQNAELKVPQSLHREHEELQSELSAAIRSGGNSGRAALAVEKVLHPHFLKEEEYALPILGLLPGLAEGKTVKERDNLIQKTDLLKSELPKMIQEHKSIVTALNQLSDAAKKEKKWAAVRFTEKLMLHAQNEEEILYPAAVLVGEYLKLQRDSAK